MTGWLRRTDDRLKSALPERLLAHTLLFDERLTYVFLRSLVAVLLFAAMFVGVLFAVGEVQHWRLVIGPLVGVPVGVVLGAAYKARRS